jgi:hypothetical protein
MFPWLLVTLLSQAPAPALDQLHLAACARQGAEYRVTLNGTLTLHKAFLDPALSPDENARLAVQQQVRYVWGWMRTNPELQRTTQAVLSAEAPLITLNSLTDTTYGRDLTLDWVQQAPHLEITDVYTLRAVQAGKVSSEDAAVRVDYSVDFGMAMCAPPRGNLSTLEVPLPLDPWLFYWWVPRSQHRPMRYFQKKAVTNPCADDDFADLPHPIYFWYDWFPDRHGPDDTGQPFDCRNLLKPGRDYFTHSLKFRKTGEANGDFSTLRREFSGKEPLRVTAIFGVMDHPVTQPDVTGLAAELAPGQPLTRRVSAALQRPQPHERAANLMLNLLWGLRVVMDLGSHAVEVADGNLLITLHGTLKRSGRAVDMRVHYGLSNVFGPVPPTHWKEARHALTQQQVILYVGHSGIGENLRLSRIEENLHLDHAAWAQEIASSPYQLVAFLSCYSYMYFGQDMLDLGSRGRDFVHTGVGYSKGDRGALMVLDVLDQALASTGTGPLKPDIRFLDREDFLLFKARRPAALR